MVKILNEKNIKTAGLSNWKVFNLADDTSAYKYLVGWTVASNAVLEKFS